ncbi:hypothetical protein AWENTII_011194 [Aspergillus wentii]
MTAVFSATRKEHSGFSPDPSRSPTAQRYYIESPSVSIKPSVRDYFPSNYQSQATSSNPSSTLPSPTTEPLPYTPATISSLSLNVANDHGEEIILPSYDTNDVIKKEQKDPEETLSETSAECSTDFQRETFRTPVADDSSVEEEPSRHVDYLSHEWKEEDMWSSWRYVAARRDIYSNGARLENASWRTWAKLKHNLGTISAESLNWLKDCDVTWLYGPLKTNNREIAHNTSPPSSRLETPNFNPEKKSILKKKTTSEAILQRSLSQHTLLQHAGAILKAQEAENSRSRPAFSMPKSEFGQMRNQISTFTSSSIGNTPTNAVSSGVMTPNGRRRIHFNNEVVQCIAVEDNNWSNVFENKFSSDDDVVTMRQILPKAPVSNQSPHRGSLSNENKTIAPLPSTTLKYRGDTPQSSGKSIMDCWSGSFWAPRPPPQTLYRNSSAFWAVSKVSSRL